MVEGLVRYYIDRDHYRLMMRRNTSDADPQTGKPTNLKTQVQRRQSNLNLSDDVYVDEIDFYSKEPEISSLSFTLINF